MLKVESLKYYYENKSPQEIEKVNDELFAIFDIASQNYPGHEAWYISKQLRETALTSKRDILFIRNTNYPFELIAISCLKKTDDEKKICTFYIKQAYRKPKVYELLIKASLTFLKTAWPLITISDEKVDMLTSIIERYNWHLTEVLPDYYQKGASELCFNGYLTPRKKPKEKFNVKLAKIFHKKIEYTK